MRELLILDGGTGRELARQGAPFRVPEWSALALIEAPEFVRRVHAAYLSVGAQVITTNSYAVVPFHLGAERFARDGERLAALAGQLAREAVVQDASERIRQAGPAGRVAAQAVGPAEQVAARHPGPAVRVAGSLPPVCGSYRADLFDQAAARPILATLVRGLRQHVDLWLAETLSTTQEARLVRDVLGEDARPLWLSFTLQDEPGRAPEPSLRSGETVASAVLAALELKAEALLFNCSQPEVMAAALAAAQAVLGTQATSLPLGVYANAFPPQPADAQANAGLDPIRDDLTPAGYLRFAEEWQARGASMVGGCCGIGPEHIAALSAAKACAHR